MTASLAKTGRYWLLLSISLQVADDQVAVVWPNMFSAKTYRRAAVSLTIFSLGLACRSTDAQDDQPEFPYQAMVMAAGAKILSGPDSVHYATDELQQDTLVEVYRHDPYGWCAIRPPTGSFSLVPESAIERSYANIGRVIEEGVPAWVGTRLGTVEQPLWQIKLRQNEEVEILGEISWPNPEGYSTIWYQISPPAGEFRWIKISDLRLPKNRTDLPEIKSRPRDISTAKSANRIATNLTAENPADEIRQSSFQEPLPDYADPQFDDEQTDIPLNPPSENEETVNRGWRQARRPIRVADNRYEFESAKPFKTPALDSSAIGAEPKSDLNQSVANAGNQPGIPNIDRSDTQTRSSSVVEVAPISGPVSDRIRKLESQLTDQMRRPPAEWEFESLLRQSTSIVSSTNDVREREHAQRLQQKIRNCVSIQARYGDAFSNRKSTNSQPGPTTSPEVSDIHLGTTYDAHGWLNRLVRDNGRLSPTYVLEDSNGKITHHIAPSPGLNLQRYLKQQVGVIGRRGYHKNLGLNHVTAERVVVINKRR